jgi:hypothetical protein
MKFFFNTSKEIRCRETFFLIFVIDFVFFPNKKVH